MCMNVARNQLLTPRDSKKRSGVCVLDSVSKNIRGGEGKT